MNAILADDVNDDEEDEQHADNRIVRPRTNFNLIGDAFKMRFRLPAERVEWIHTRIGMRLRPVQPRYYALSSRDKLLVLIRQVQWKHVKNYERIQIFKRRWALSSDW